jgi:hypothetical protein
MVLIVFDVQPLTAGIALATRIVLIPTNLDYVVVLDPDFKATEICTQYTGCFFPIHNQDLLSLFLWGG